VRRLIGALVVVALLVAALAVADVVVRHRVQSALAGHIEEQLPGSRASVAISSFPFVGRLAMSGTVPEVTAKVSNVAEGGITLEQVDVELSRLKVDNGQLIHRRVVLQGIGSGTVTAEISQATVDQQLGAPLTLGAGTVELDGVQARPPITASGSAISLGLPSLPPLRIPAPVLSILPCLSSASVVPGALEVSCQLASLPPLLAGYSARF
jgi:hypothetical protein